jgi:hypothetical protein
LADGAAGFPSARDLIVARSDLAGMRRTKVVALRTAGGQEVGAAREDVVLKLFLKDVEPALTPSR